MADRRPAVFLDRDGTLNADTGYMYRIQDFSWLPEAREAIRWLNEAGYYVFVVTNQSGVGRGYYSEVDVERLHAWMQRELAAAGAHVDAFRYCPHHPEADLEAYRRVCQCRKPAPGMLLGLMADWPVEPKGSFMVGDRQSDMQAAEAAGLHGVLYEGGSLLALCRRAVAAR